ncbi:MAG: DUF433 domain-containing protein [Desulfobacterales bacterium]|nr:DUF433 domain-containing protein [Desulfobacterales bacterium]
MGLASAETKYEHIELDKAGIPIISGTNMKVIELVLGKIAHGWSPEELHFQHPFLTLGQIYSALAYYCDHQKELDQDIDRRLEFVNKLQEKATQPSLITKLKSKGSI